MNFYFCLMNPGTRLARNRLGIPEPAASHRLPRPLWTLDLVLTRWWDLTPPATGWEWAERIL